MYNKHVGANIKSLVSITTTIGYVAYIVLGLLVMIKGDGSAAGILGVVIAGIGCLVTWITGLTLYAFGEIAERIVSIDEFLHDERSRGTKTGLVNRAKDVSHDERNRGTNTGIVNSAKDVSHDEKSKDADNLPNKEVMQNDQKIKEPEVPMWSCPSCGAVNPGQMQRCRKCFASKPCANE